jgi:hypothetical protein
MRREILSGLSLGSIFGDHRFASHNDMGGAISYLWRSLATGGDHRRLLTRRCGHVGDIVRFGGLFIRLGGVPKSYKCSYYLV